MTKRRALGTNPLDSLLSSSESATRSSTKESPARVPENGSSPTPSHPAPVGEQFAASAPHSQFAQQPKASPNARGQSPSSSRKTTPSQASKSKKATASKAPQPDEHLESPKKKRHTFLLSTQMMERARNAVFYTPGLTLAHLVEEAISEKLKRYEKKHGGPFPSRTQPLKSGRPIR